MSNRFEYAGLVIEILTDEFGENPRDKYEHVATLALFSRRYRLGDSDHDIAANQFSGWQEMGDWLKQCALGVTPVYLLDHSGLALNTEDFNDPWDSGQVGFGYVDPEALHAAGLTADQARDVVEAEVTEYHLYLSGQVYGYRITDPQTSTEIDSCWGLYGYEYAYQCAIDSARPYQTQAS